LRLRRLVVRRRACVACPLDRVRRRAVHAQQRDRFGMQSGIASALRGEPRFPFAGIAFERRAREVERTAHACDAVVVAVRHDDHPRAHASAGSRSRMRLNRNRSRR
jgi:hypothetical protein